MSDFSASDSLLGYFYQVRYALYLLLGTGKSARLETQLSIQVEGLDDITVYTETKLYELLQTKHIKDTNKKLTDSSKEFWKTIRIWSTYLVEGKICPPDTDIILTLVITSMVSEDSIMSWLRPDNSRNPSRAIQAMKDFVASSKAEDKKPAFEAFLALTEAQQMALVSAIQILELSPKIGELEQEIKNLLSLTVRPQHADIFFSELDSWWFTRVVKQLQSESEVITYQELHQKIQKLRDQYTEDSLPLFDNLDLTLPENINDYQFVRQLEEIGYKRRKEAANYTHRNKWFVEGFLSDEEISRYEDKLVREWDDQFERFLDDYESDNQYPLDAAKDLDLQKIGRDIYNAVSEVDIRIRPKVTEKYIMRGSYHILADKKPAQKSDDLPKVYWHPKFKVKLKQEE
ncbi:MAG: hypothetical protein BWK78_06910 [Thiotrichaceae bacterium IS1]|nr:MAG: hypothetical protein BWK78_06910 [Thiotrichaceae bacterium IS1]